MLIGERLKAIREAKGMSQGDIENKTGFMRSYVSRIENGHTVPHLNTLEKWARALGLSLGQLFAFDNERNPVPQAIPDWKEGFGGTRAEARFLKRMCGVFAKLNESERQLVLIAAMAFAKRKRGPG